MAKECALCGDKKSDVPKTKGTKTQLWYCCWPKNKGAKSCYRKYIDVFHDFDK